jgi:hypothetical protein
VQAVKIDNRAIYIDQSTRKLWLATYDIWNYNYKATELSNFNRDIGFFGYIGMAIQRNPDTAVLLIRGDGQMVSLVYDEEDQVKAFWRIYTDGIYEDVIVQPGVYEDQVYVVVNRNGVRFIEKFARLDECTGGAVNKIADCHFFYQGGLTKNISIPWLAGRTVVCWADGLDAGPITLDSHGNGVLSQAAANICAGIGYTAQFVSAKLAYAAQQGSAVNQVKRVDHVGMVLQNTHAQAIEYGAYNFSPLVGAGNQPTSENSGLWDQGEPLDPMPAVERDLEVPKGSVWAFYDMKMFEAGIDADTDVRLQLICNAPLPATVLAFTMAVETAN